MLPCRLQISFRVIARQVHEHAHPRNRGKRPHRPRVSADLARTGGKSLGIVTTSDVFDATPAAFGSHTQGRGAGTGICDGFFDEQVAKANLRVLLGGGRKWFLPSTTPGSGRSASNDAVLPADVRKRLGRNQ